MICKYLHKVYCKKCVTFLLRRCLIDCSFASNRFSFTPDSLGIQKWVTSPLNDLLLNGLNRLYMADLNLVQNNFQVTWSYRVLNYCIHIFRVAVSFFKYLYWSIPTQCFQQYMVKTAELLKLKTSSPKRKHQYRSSNQLHIFCVKKYTGG